MFTLSTIKASPLEEDLRPYRARLPEIDDFYQQYSHYEDEQLRQLGRELKMSAPDHEAQGNILPQAFALVKEVCRRLLGLTAFDEQLLAGLALHQGKMVEMQTGEGKTLSALFPAYLNALSGKGVHILTFNDYLARRDAEWSRPVFEFLSHSVGFIQQHQSLEERQRAYRADITYATAKAAGFDYLRAFIAHDPEEVVQRAFHYAIVDEADALMIDEARNPLVLAGNMDNTPIDAYAMAALAAELVENTDFSINEYDRNIFLTETGIKKLEEKWQISNLMEEAHHQRLTAITVALHARMLLHRDIDYVVREDQVLLVDEFTGRIVTDRKWRSGLQRAVEAKEAVPIRAEGRLLNAISLQHFLYRYPKLAGMTATARAAAEEFENFYELKTVIIPPHLPSRRMDAPDLIFAGKAAKTEAIVREVSEVHRRRQPILIGTLTVKESEMLAARLHQEGIACEVLNAKNDAREAAVIARAGKLGQVTISTNMAGRGTDIVPGGGAPGERAQVLALGGLYVIGTNRHESTRIDQQLRGRTGRQGDVGISRFFISLEDDLMIKYRLAEALPKKYRNLPQDDLITDQNILKFIDHIQRVIEGQTYDMRRTLLLYTDLAEKQRLIIQQERQSLLLDDAFLLERCNLPPETALTTQQLRLIRGHGLNIYDRCWSDHLGQLQQMKEGIYLVRFGGQKPLREYQRLADQWFDGLCQKIDQALEKGALDLLAQAALPANAEAQYRPSSTWTYVVNDNPFGNQLAISLLDNSNLGMQADPISAMLLFFASLFRKRRKS